jgi:hypothetical protein
MAHAKAKDWKCNYCERVVAGVFS